VTLDHCNTAQEPENRRLVFYHGKGPADGKPFSFVPCRQADNPNCVQGHDRVILDYKEFGLLWGRKGFFRQGCGSLNRGAHAVSEEAVLKFWKKIANYCQKQKFLLGHSIGLPPIE
jgi:hypothetical protein